ncbi:sulfotransferase [Moorena producens JHB]|uniref:Sulfotransferase n=1 Tax=Moorena producens (strain JHB) TaxID=1454205 RepID=A0A1D9G0W1_MOOP1|nr:sulfotransferase [Moorena producens]AOY81256.1 sulfotransferase [Moorena producens JHB]
MNAKIHKINRKTKIHPLGIAAPTDFEFDEGEDIAVETLLKNPHISLYCLDPDERRVILVETPEDVVLSDFPFYYSAQYEQAVRLVTLSYDRLHDIADKIDFDSQQLILIYSVGRCGSTLLSSALNQVNNITVFSEPDVYSQLVRQRQWNGNNDALISQLLVSCTKLLCRQSTPKISDRRWVIKLRSYGIELADLLANNFPQAKILFLYRQIETWIPSSLRASIGEIPDTPESLESMQKAVGNLVSLIARFPEPNRPLSYIEILTVTWLSVLECLQRLHQQGYPPFIINFEDLIATPNSVIKQIFDFCDLPHNNLSQILKVFTQDSQSSTALSWENLQRTQPQLTPEQLEQYLREATSLVNCYTNFKNTELLTSKSLISSSSLLTDEI